MKNKRVIYLWIFVAKMNFKNCLLTTSLFFGFWLLEKKEILSFYWDNTPEEDRRIDWPKYSIDYSKIVCYHFSFLLYIAEKKILSFHWNNTPDEDWRRDWPKCSIDYPKIVWLVLQHINDWWVISGLLAEG